MDEVRTTTTEDPAKGDALQSVWHTGCDRPSRGPWGGGPKGGGPLLRQRVLLMGWDRSRSFIFAGLSLAFIVWAAVFFPLVVK